VSVAQTITVIVMAVLLLGSFIQLVDLHGNFAGVPGRVSSSLASIVGVLVLGGAVVLLLGAIKRKRTKYLFLSLGLVVLLLCPWSWLRICIGVLVLCGAALLTLDTSRKPKPQPPTPH